MIWAVYAMLGVQMWQEKFDTLVFNDEVWDKIVDECHKAGVNTIVLDIAEGVEWKSHPELSVKGAWSCNRVKKEIERLRRLGIAIVPKLNFSATHHLWLGEYRKMMSTKIYYDVCRELIEEVYDLFEKPEYIHLGMDEEGNKFITNYTEGIWNFRRGELYWHDLKFLCDTVTRLGAKPWIWSDSCCEHPEDFRKHFSLDSVLLSPWYYMAFKREHFQRISDSGQKNIDFYANTFPYNMMGLEYIEDDPGYVKMRQDMEKSAGLGYGLVPCFSLWSKNPYNATDLLEFYLEKAPECFKGYMAAPWHQTLKQHSDEIIDNIRVLGEIIKKF